MNRKVSFAVAASLLLTATIVFGQGLPGQQNSRPAQSGPPQDARPADRRPQTNTQPTTNQPRTKHIKKQHKSHKGKDQDKTVS